VRQRPSSTTDIRPGRLVSTAVRLRSHRGAGEPPRHRAHPTRAYAPSWAESGAARPPRERSICRPARPHAVPAPVLPTRRATARSELGSCSSSSSSSRRVAGTSSRPREINVKTELVRWRSGVGPAHPLRPALRRCKRHARRRTRPRWRSGAGARRTRDPMVSRMRRSRRSRRLRARLRSWVDLLRRCGARWRLGLHNSCRRVGSGVDARTTSVAFGTMERTRSTSIARGEPHPVECGSRVRFGVDVGVGPHAVRLLRERERPTMRGVRRVRDLAHSSRGRGGGRHGQSFSLSEWMSNRFARSARPPAMDRALRCGARGIREGPYLLARTRSKGDARPTVVDFGEPERSRSTSPS
jgi:hypothetical protein